MNAIILVMLVLGGVVPTVVAVVMVARGAKTNRAAFADLTEHWRAWASARGFTFEGAWPSMQMRGRCHGLDAQFVTERQMDATEDGSSDYFTVIVSSPIDLGELSVCRPKVFAVFERALRGPAVEIGDPEFDAAFTVRTPDLAAAQALLTPRVRAALLEARVAYPDVAVGANGVRNTWRGIPDLAATEVMFDVLGRTARTFGT